jgi:hypothetical protein
MVREQMVVLAFLQVIARDLLSVGDVVPPRSDREDRTREVVLALGP